MTNTEVPFPTYTWSKCRVVLKDGTRCSYRAEAHRVCGGHLRRMSPDILKKIAR